jgi:hypothetical protein
MRNSNPGQNQKTDVVGNKQQTSPPRRGLPSDEPIPIFDFEGSTGPAHTGNYLAMKKGEVSQVLSNQSGLPQVMIVMNQIIPQIALACSHQLQGRFAILLKSTFHRGLRESQRNLKKGIPLKVVLRSQSGRKRNQSFFFQAQQQIPCRTLLELPIGLHPVPGFTDHPGNLGPAFPVELSNHALEELNVLHLKIPGSIAEHNSFHNVLLASEERYTVLLTLSPAFFYSFFKERFSKN